MSDGRNRRSSLPRGTVAALMRRPDLWATAVAQGVRLAPRRWWARRPFLPLPAPGYMHLRLVTALGGEGDPADASARDVVSYLEWCRAWPEVAGASHQRG